ncbi:MULTISPECIES: LacI family DNA-binding transcriptional regulator [unclassified Microbacterium]|uniref:LacI family DNA-binding transcriptional regulator n=1 Tax=unclassified Microbacterium TaxID=2609290 RepID=UPI00097EFA0B|nr:LacI family DNA-binding transcriptional regulator [Microbacterium sp. JB110]RCS60831.1 LacI family transcriptional regulator [Microbacterium sp. JB110]SJM64495.1 LacI-type transcriptional regulator [Frigoribacterium sp. JB110]
MASTMQDVAQLAGVSMKTVSNVIHEHPHVRPSTRERVRAAIDELGYRPNMSARGLRSGRTGVIGLAVPSLRENYFAELADAVIRAADRHGLSVLVEQTSGDREREVEVLTDKRARLTDGLLFSPVGLGQPDAPLLDTEFPLVLLGERIFGGPTDHVAMHNVSSARAAVEHLIDIGRRRIAVIGAEHDADDEASSARLRVAGYFQALEGASIPVDPDLIRHGPHWSRSTGAMAIRGLLRDGVGFDAVFALNDSLGLGALRALGEAGLRSPEDVAVIGFDNIDESQFTVPSMSSVDVGRDQIATDAVDMLIERIENKAPGQRPRTVKPDYRIIRRESTGFPVHGRSDVDGERS